MRNLLALAAVAVIGFAAIGWFRGWYTFGTTPTADGGRHIDINVNNTKITQDIKAGKDKLRNMLTSDKKTEYGHPTSYVPEGYAPPGYVPPGYTPPGYAPQVPQGVSATFRTPSGEFTLPAPPVPPGSIDISDHDGWWPVSPRK